MARILILGGAGFVGYHLTRRLSQEPGHVLTLVDDLSRGRMDPDLEALVSLPRVQFVKADLTDPSTFAGIPREWDQIYMLAAVVGVRNVVTDPARVIRVNALATLNLLEWMTDRSGVLFFASTSEIYAGGVSRLELPVPTPEVVPVSVEAVENPRFAYAASKILGEAATIHYSAAKNLRFVIGRLHNVYGPRMGTDHAIPELCLRALDREDPFQIYGLEQRRAFCHVTDAVEAVMQLMATEKAWGQIVNVGNDAEETNVADLLALILRVAGFSPRLEPLPAPAGSVDRRCPDLSRLRALTGFIPKVSLESGVCETFGWYQGWREREGVRSAG